MKIKISDDYFVELDDLKELNKEIEGFCANLDKLSGDSVLFFSMQDVQDITGWSRRTVEDLFNYPEFPCTDIGKKKLVLKSAFVKFFSTRRCKDNQNHWRFAA